MTKRTRIVGVLGFTALLVSTFGTAASAQTRATPEASADTLRLSLDEAVGRATRLNEDVLIARAEQARSRGIAREVRARSLPEISGTMSYTRNVQRPVLFFNAPEGQQQISIGDDNEYSFGLTLNQPLLDLSLGPARTAARLDRERSEAQVENARVSVALQTRVAYYDVLLDRALLNVQERAIEQARQRLDETRKFYEAGTGSEFDLLTAQVEVDNLKPRVIQARNRLELDRNQFKRIVGLPLDQAIALTDSLEAPPEAVLQLPSLEEATDRALDARPDLQAQRFAVGLQEENIAAEQRSALPSLDLDAAFTRRASSADVWPEEPDFTQSVTAGLTLAVPIFDGRARSGRVQQAKAAADRERYRLAQLRMNARLDVQQSYQSMQAALEAIRASESTVERAERALEIARTRLRNGLSTQVEQNDAELAVTEARSNYAEAVYSYRVAKAQLDAALGER